MAVLTTGGLALVELPGVQHTFDLLWSLRYSFVIDAVDAFVRSRTEK
ncbi:hypothetical protein [Paractinoplanes maris]|nr:hypothetical protein [Actinoplanes maris]